MYIVSDTLFSVGDVGNEFSQLISNFFQSPRALVNSFISFIVRTVLNPFLIRSYDLIPSPMHIHYPYYSSEVFHVHWIRSAVMLVLSCLCLFGYGFIPISFRILSYFVLSDGSFLYNIIQFFLFLYSSFFFFFLFTSNILFSSLAITTPRCSNI